MTATRPTPRPTLVNAGAVSSINDLKSTNAATNKLKIAPLSAPSMTQMPTAKPASAKRDQRTNGPVSSEFAIISPNAKKTIPIAICTDAVPQHAFPK
ncbi:MAG TPA: hypothetical protein VGY98_01860 [Verrucomicrobiae bacterium]|nr:hypothetical protein [Verrucomicrobiae bacterium]